MSQSTGNGPHARLRLDPGNGWIGGVCAGIANRLETDPAFVRIVVVLAGLAFPTVLVVGYLAAWILLGD